MYGEWQACDEWCARIIECHDFHRVALAKIALREAPDRMGRAATLGIQRRKDMKRAHRFILQAKLSLPGLVENHESIY